MNNFEARDELTADGRRVHCWVNLPKDFHDNSPVAVLVVGFGRRMHQYSGLCQYLTANGVAVVRFDSLNHLGLSDGEMLAYTLSDGFVSMEVALVVTRKLFGRRPTTLIATSMSARLALRRFHQDGDLDRLITMSGVVNLRTTLSRVFEEDYTACSEEELPPHVVFETNHIGAKAFIRDGHEHDWFSGTTAAAEIAGLTREAFYFIGTDDDWVDLSEVEKYGAANAGKRVHVTPLMRCGHEIGRNASISRSLIRQVARLCSFRENNDEEFVEPTYTDTLGVSLKERRIQRHAS